MVCTPVHSINRSTSVGCTKGRMQLSAIVTTNLYMCGISRKKSSIHHDPNNRFRISAPTLRRSLAAIPFPRTDLFSIARRLRYGITCNDDWSKGREEGRIGNIVPQIRHHKAHTCTKIHEYATSVSNMSFIHVLDD